MITDPFSVLLVLAAVILVAVRLEARFRVVRSLSAALVGILVAMALSNVGLLPGDSPTYAFLSGTGVSLAIAFILLGVDLRSVLEAGPRMLGAFAVGALGTALGAVGGGLLLAGSVGPETWKLAGQFTGTYTGGGANFAALGRAFDTSADLFSAAIAADVLLTAVWMAACLAVPVLLGRRRAASAAPGDGTPAPRPAAGTLEQKLHSSVAPLTMTDAAALTTIAVGAVWGARQLQALTAVHEVLWLTTIVLALAQLPAVRALRGSALIGNYLLLLFLAANGAQSVIANLVAAGPPVFYYALVTVAVHGAVTFGLGPLLGLDLTTLAVASQANVGGPASAIALATARGTPEHLLPGLAVGLLGYAIGNYLGFATGALVRLMLGI